MKDIDNRNGVKSRTSQKSIKQKIPYFIFQAIQTKLYPRSRSVLVCVLQTFECGSLTISLIVHNYTKSPKIPFYFGKLYIW